MTVTNLISNEAPFSDAQIALASSNYEAQEWLVRELHRAFRMSELTISELAEELELDEDDAQAWIDGDVDLRLSDLRHLANAIDARVTYRVGAIVNKYAERIVQIENSGMWQESSHDVWSKAPVAVSV